MNDTQFNVLENEYFDLAVNFYKELYEHLSNKFSYYKYGHQYSLMRLKTCIEIKSNTKILKVYMSNNMIRPCYILEVYDNLEEITVEREIMKVYKNINSFNKLYNVIAEELKNK